MASRLLGPRWLLSHVLVAGVAIAFVFLGLWQIDRHQQRVAGNEVGQTRLGLPVASLGDLLVEAGGDLESIRYRRVQVEGVFHPEDEVLIRSQVHLGNAGFHVVTPLLTAEGTAVLVNRGWVPLELDRVPVDQAPPPGGEVGLEAWVNTTQLRRGLGPTDPATGRLEVLNRVDIGRIEQQLGYQVAPVYLVAIAANDADLPAPADPPSFDDNGPHLAYAIQWFGFAVVGLVGYFFLARRRLTRGSPQG